MGGNHNKPQNQSGLGGFASSLLGGQGSHGGNGQGGSGGLAGQLVGGLLGGKPHNQQSGQGQGQSGAHGQGGLMGMASGFLGGRHGSGVRPVLSLKSVTDSFLGLQQQLWLLLHRPK